MFVEQQEKVKFQSSTASLLHPEKWDDNETDDLKIMINTEDGALGRHFHLCLHKFHFSITQTDIHIPCEIYTL